MNTIERFLGMYVNIDVITFVIPFAILLFLVGTCVLYLVARLLRTRISLTASAAVTFITDVAAVVLCVLMFGILEYNFYDAPIFSILGDWTSVCVLSLCLLIIGAYTARTRLHLPVWKAALLSCLTIPLTYVLGFVLLYSVLIQSWLNIG